jgi:NADH:flavin oxidoreductase / NADH oxidase family
MTEVTMTLKQFFSPLQVGALNLPNRIVMAPLTRGRAGKERIPNDMMAEYYALRAEAGLIITEARLIQPRFTHMVKKAIWIIHYWRKVRVGDDVAAGDDETRNLKQKSEPATDLRNRSQLAIYANSVFGV